MAGLPASVVARAAVVAGELREHSEAIQKAGSHTLGLLRQCVRRIKAAENSQGQEIDCMLELQHAIQQDPAVQAVDVAAT